MSQLTEWITAAGAGMTGLAALAAGWAAIRGVDAWRGEAVGRRKAELAEEVLSQFYRARDVLTWARLPEEPMETDSPQEPQESADDRDRMHRSLVSPIERLTQESPLFSELQASRYRFMAYFGEDAVHPFEEISAIHNEVVLSAQALMMQGSDGYCDEDRDRMEGAIGWIRPEDDPIARRLAATIVAVERLCRPLIAEHHLSPPGSKSIMR